MRKEILIEAGHSDELTLDTIIHECTHAGNWNLDEEHVREWSQNVAHILTELGFHRDKNAPLPYKQKEPA